MVGFIQVPKVFLLRTCAILLVVLMGLKVTTESRRPDAIGQSISDLLKAGLSTAASYLRGHPIILAAAGVLVANLISLSFSPMPTVSLGGTDPGRDSYSLTSVASYFVVFVAIAISMRNVVQVRRLFWALTISSLILSAYGVGQYLGFDLFREELPVQERIWLTFGSATFGSAYLLMTIPLTMGLWQGWQQRFSRPIHIAIGVALVMPQVGVVALALSRSSIIGMIFSLVLFVGLSFWVFGLKGMRRPASILAAGMCFALVISFLPVSGVSATRSNLVDRLSTIPSAFTNEGGGLSLRYTIWGYSASAFGSTPWANTVENPEIPVLTVKPLRRLVGYGPEMFRYAISFAGGASARPDAPAKWQSAHNFLIHAAIELGLFGALAYLALIATVALALYRLLQEARRGLVTEPLAYVVIGLAAVLVGRGIEQVTGKAQVSDLALSWILGGVVVAIVSMRSRTIRETSAVANTPVPHKQELHRTSIRRRASGTAGALPASTAANITCALLIIAALLLWSQTVVGTVRSSLLLGEAQRASEAGRIDLTEGIMKRAILTAPQDVTPRFLLSQGLLSGAKQEPDPALKLPMLLTAYEIIGDVFLRNPMDHKARLTASEISTAIMFLDTTWVSTAVRNREIDTALSPWLWKIRDYQARTLFEVGSLEEAIEALNLAKQLGADESPDAYYVHYVYAKANFALGRIEAAKLAVQAFKRSPYKKEHLEADLNAELDALSKSL